MFQIFLILWTPKNWKILTQYKRQLLHNMHQVKYRGSATAITQIYTAPQHEPLFWKFFLWICLCKSRETGTKKNLHIHTQRGTADNGQNELSPKDTVNNHCITS